MKKLIVFSAFLFVCGYPKHHSNFTKSVKLLELVKKMCRFVYWFCLCCLCYCMGGLGI